MKKQFLGSEQVYLFRGIAVFYCPKKTRSTGSKRRVFSPVSIFRHTLWLLFIQDQDVIPDDFSHIPLAALLVIVRPGFVFSLQIYSSPFT